MSLDKIYRSMSDLMRLRILNLLNQGPLCVCHIQEILNESQVKTSKQLAYMKKNGLLEVKRQGYWNIYSLTTPIHPLLKANLDNLDQIHKEFPQFKKDLEARQKLIKYINNQKLDCPTDVMEPA